MLNFHIEKPGQRVVLSNIQYVEYKNETTTEEQGMVMLFDA